MYTEWWWQHILTFIYTHFLWYSLVHLWQTHNINYDISSFFLPHWACLEMNLCHQIIEIHVYATVNTTTINTHWTEQWIHLISLLQEGPPWLIIWMYAISAYHCSSCEFIFHWRRGVLDATLCGKVCQLPEEVGGLHMGGVVWLACSRRVW